MNVAIKVDHDLRGLKLSREDEEIMKSCVALSSDVWTGLVDGEIACVWGVSPPSLMSNQAYLWLYTTNLVREHQFTFVRHSQIVIKQLLDKYDLITGVYSIGNRDSRRWLAWLGATFGEPRDGLIPFQIRKQ